MGSGRGVHGKENPRKFYAAGLRAEPALIVRGSSRRITIMRFRPANIRVNNRREDYLDHDLRCLLRARRNKEENSRSQLTGHSISELIRTCPSFRLKGWANLISEGRQLWSFPEMMRKQIGETDERLPVC